MPKVIKRGPGEGPLPHQSSMRPAAPSVLSSAPKMGPKAPIIQKELVDANAEARRLVHDAELQAQQIIEQAKDGAQAAHEKGFDEGYQEALGAYTEQTTRAILQLRQKEEAMEMEFIKLVRVCVEKILGQEIKLNPDAVTGIVRNALHDARQQREIIVRVHPDDTEGLNKNRRRLMEMLARANSIEIREDPSITRGGCVVMTELGMIDASLDRQLDAIEAAIEQEIREGDPGGGGGEEYAAGNEELDQEDDPGAGYGSY